MYCETIFDNDFLLVLKNYSIVMSLKQTDCLQYYLPEYLVGSYVKFFLRLFSLAPGIACIYLEKER